jgi:enoyl-CoA hydratase/3-hydroxyacyl-CoA dehydrogenase
MFVFKAAVVGAGTMGGEIAQAIAAADIDVVLKDVDQKFVDHGIEHATAVTKGQLDRLVKKEKLTQEQADARLSEVIGHIEGTTDYSGFGDVDFVIEAAPERMDIKQQVFRELDEATPGHAILSSNTSSLSISEMAEATLRPDKVVGFHFFYPASIMPLLEIVEGAESSPETVTAAVNFARKIRKQPITCAEVPGFVVNRILNSAVGEIWRAQEERGLSIKSIDEGVAAAQVAPMGPFVLVDMLGLDTVLHVAEHLKDSYGDSFYVHEGMSKLVADGKLGAKSGGDGFYKDGEPQIEGDADADGEELANLWTSKALVEACLVLEEGVCSAREIDFGMMAGAGLDPRRGLFPPFMKADLMGLDVALENLEAAAEKYGERFAPPVVLKRLVAQGRLGAKSGQGFYAYPQADEGEQTDTVKLETRGDVAIAWLANPPMNSISPQVIEDLGTVWKKVEDEGIRAVVFASSIPVVFSAGADIKAFTKMDEAGGKELIDQGHALLRSFGRSSVATIAAVNSLAFGGGCELAMACDFRIAAESASFGQPEVNLGIIPGFGGTQRLPRLVGWAKALEMNLIGDEITGPEAAAYGLANRVVPDHELFDTALSWARKLAGQAPIAIREIKDKSARGELDEGIDAEKEGFATAFFSEDAKEGIGAFLGKRTPHWKGE